MGEAIRTFAVGLMIAGGAALILAGVLTLWPQRIPTGRSVTEIRDRVLAERTDAGYWPVGWPHEAPDGPLGVYEARLTLERHRHCRAGDGATPGRCGRKLAAEQALSRPVRHL